MKSARSIRNSLRSQPAVRAWSEDVVIPTYMPAPPDTNPMFLETRVYQGSSGKVYPLPFTDRISEQKIDRKWRVLWIENEYLRAMILPELGGRIHRLVDKTNSYDLVYYQPVIKPALVGLAGPWISGGIEFNWPQHHRPATFLPTQVSIETHQDGSVTVWCSDHDVMTRMKGMHGVCLHPGRACVELKVRAYNRTPYTQTFLWWANVATRVHEGYQSFFPPDVRHVADHAKRAMSTYPLCDDRYYGINYAERARSGVPVSEIPPKYSPPRCNSKSLSLNGGPANPSYEANDLSWYANIATPCSYMCVGSKEDFFGGYDHFAKAGLVHVADHHIAPGKKQWTWGNHPFGYAWDRNLTDARDDGEFPPYIELMAGVFTDNQPDFSFLQPYETKSWSQYWYPIHEIGPAQKANGDAAISLRLPGAAKSSATIGVSVTRAFAKVTIEVSVSGKCVASFTRDLAPGAAMVKEVKLPGNPAAKDVSVKVFDNAGMPIVGYSPLDMGETPTPEPATEPAAPKSIQSTDELYLTGLHLEQYRHATRSPTDYWSEALRRDPSDSRCNNAMGLWHLRHGEFTEGEQYFRVAIKRLTGRNPNPRDGEVYFNLGLCLRFQASAISHLEPPARELLEDAYAAFYKATWNQAWCAAGFTALAEMDCARIDWPKALEHIGRALRFDSDHLWARDLKALVLKKLGRDKEAEKLLRETLGLDPLDWCARYLMGLGLECDLQTALDVGHDFARAGFLNEAVGVLENRLKSHRENAALRSNFDVLLPDQSWGAEPLAEYTLGWLYERAGKREPAVKHRQLATKAEMAYCFPARLEEIAVLESATRENPKDARAFYYLGNLLYDRRRHVEAIRLWETSAKLDPGFSIAWRNLGIGLYNVQQRPVAACRAYEKAFRSNPSDARLLYERDQLWKRVGKTPRARLRELERHESLVRERDDLSIELCALYNQSGQHEKAAQILTTRTFQPWEGGEGQALGQHVRTHLALGCSALSSGDFIKAAEHFEHALCSPENLGEAKHILANQSDIHYWLGVALAAMGRSVEAREHWQTAATSKGDFQEMKVRSFSEMTYYSALAWRKLGRSRKAAKLLQGLLAYARELAGKSAQTDYFATSLPSMLLFHDDLGERQRTTALLLEAQAQLGFGRKARSRALLHTVLKRDPNHSLAADLLREL